jgi:hypothetical protein
MEEKKFVTAEELETARQDVLKNGGKHCIIGMVCAKLAIFCGIGLCPAIIILQSPALDSDWALPAWIFLGFCTVGLVVFFIAAEFDHFVDTPLFIKAGGKKGNVSTEHTAFDNTFSIFCDNPVDALRILTPQMMDDILAIRDLCKKPINLSFFDDKIYFNCEPGRDLLEIALDIKKPIPEARKQIDSDIDFITSILDRLNMRNLKSMSSRRQRTDEDFAGNAVYQNEQF